MSPMANCPTADKVMSYIFMQHLINPNRVDKLQTSLVVDRELLVFQAIKAELSIRVVHSKNCDTPASFRLEYAKFVQNLVGRECMKLFLIDIFLGRLRTLFFPYVVFSTELESGIFSLATGFSVIFQIGRRVSFTTQCSKVKTIEFKTESYSMSTSTEYLYLHACYFGKSISKCTKLANKANFLETSYMVFLLTPTSAV